MSNSCACTDDSCDCTISGNDLKRKMFADLDIPETPKPDDAADALAVAICHNHSIKLKSFV